MNLFYKYGTMLMNGKYVRVKVNRFTKRVTILTIGYLQKRTW